MMWEMKEINEVVVGGKDLSGGVGRIWGKI